MIETEDYLVEEFRQLERDIAIRDCKHETLIGKSIDGPFQCDFCGRPESELPNSSKRGMLIRTTP